MSVEEPLSWSSRTASPPHRREILRRIEAEGLSARLDVKLVQRASRGLLAKHYEERSTSASRSTDRSSSSWRAVQSSVARVTAGEQRGDRGLPLIARRLTDPTTAAPGTIPRRRLPGRDRACACSRTSYTDSPRIRRPRARPLVRLTDPPHDLAPRVNFAFSGHPEPAELTLGAGDAAFRAWASAWVGVGVERGNIDPRQQPRTPGGSYPCHPIAFPFRTRHGQGSNPPAVVLTKRGGRS
jgi:hypothetical protein